jgi:hypothetical protein
MRLAGWAKSFRRALLNATCILQVDKFFRTLILCPKTQIRNRFVEYKPTSSSADEFTD